MRKNNRKGFTIVELVIVIAVIAILAGVLIPTFAGIVEKANKSAALQEATNLYKQLLTEDEYKGDLDLNKTEGEADLYIKITDNKTYYYEVIDGEINLDEDMTIDPVTEATGTAGNPYYKALTEDYANVFVYAGEQEAASVEPGT